MKPLFTVFLCLLTLKSLAQSEKTLALDPVIGMGNSLAFYHVTKENLDVEVDGSRYFFEDMKPGMVKMKDGTKYIDDLFVRYNVFKDQLEVVKKDVRFIAINRYVSGFIIEDESENHEFYNSNLLSAPSPDITGFVRLLYKGEVISVYAKHTKKRNRK